MQAMLFFGFFQWWYGAGWLEKWRAVGLKLKSHLDYFSIGTLLKTLFAPWKQIISEPVGGRGHSAMQRLVDNAVSRFVGFGVRLFVLIAGLITVILSFLIDLTLAVVWPALPVVPIVLIVISAGAG